MNIAGVTHHFIGDSDIGIGARVGVGAGNCVVAGQAAFRYSFMRPSHLGLRLTSRDRF